MAAFTINIPDEELERVITALCAKPLFMPTPPVPIDPPTEDGARQCIVDWVKRNVEMYELEKAKAAVLPPDTSGLVT